jgi:hypothetical protein
MILTLTFHSTWYIQVMFQYYRILIIYHKCCQIPQIYYLNSETWKQTCILNIVYIIYMYMISQ